MTEAYLALGSNMGDRLANLAAALDELAAQPGVRLHQVSPVHESEPWGVADQPPFANAVVSLDFDGEANVLLDVCKDIEMRLGRRPGERFGPRVIDLDILLFGDEEWRSDDLTIPHPRMLERDFVVTPLLEIAPRAVLPDGSPVASEGATAGRVTGGLGPVPRYQGITPGTAVPSGTPPPADAVAEQYAEESGPLADGEFVTLPAVVPTPAETAEEWVPVGPVRHERATPNSSADFDQLLYEQALRQAGVPSEFYPHRPGEGASLLYSLSVDVRLMVPKSRQAEAAGIIDALRRQDESARRRHTR